MIVGIIFKTNFLFRSHSTVALILENTPVKRTMLSEVLLELCCKSLRLVCETGGLI